MQIIIEGADGSGKSTLAAALSKYTKYPVVHRSAPKTDEEKTAMMQMYKQAIKEGRNLIWDRCWYSEMAYGPVFRDTSVISYVQMYELERSINKHGGGIIVYCTDTPERLWKRCQKRGEEYVKHKADFIKVCEAFDEIMHIPHLLPVVTYAIPAN